MNRFDKLTINRFDKLTIKKYKGFILETYTKDGHVAAYKDREHAKLGVATIIGVDKKAVMERINEIENESA